MSMLRFVLRKINVIHNSLIKFWSVRKSNEGASLFQSIAQSRVKLKLDETGRISNFSIWLIIFFVIFAILMPLSWFWFFAPNPSFWPSLGLSSGISLVVSIPITINFVNYLNKPELFASIRFLLNGMNGKVEFYYSNSSQSNSSNIAQNIMNLARSGRISLNCKNLKTQIVIEICNRVSTNLNINPPNCIPRNDNIEVQFTSNNNNETYFCSVVYT